MSATIAPLPIIDLTAFGTNDEREKKAVAEQLAAACVSHGAFYVKSGDIGGLTREFRQKVFDAAGDFFGLPKEVKEAIPIQPGGFTRGYVGLGGESGSSDLLEVKEAFSYGYPWPEATPSNNKLQGANKWPDTAFLPPHWKDTLDLFFAGMVQVAESVTRGLSIALGMEEDYLSQFCAEGDTISLMRLFHYFPYEKADRIPGAQPTSSRIGSSPHTDWGFLTLIMQQDGVTGLQLDDGQGEWMDVPPIPGTFLVNAGDYLSLLTNGRVISPLHRVVSAGSVERMSMVFFYYPSYDAKIPVMKEGGPVSRISLFQDQSGKTDGSKSKQMAVKEVAFGEYINGKWAQVFRGVDNAVV